ASNLYGGTYTQFDAILPDLGINTRWANVKDLSSFEKAINEKTRLVYIETIGNPVLDFADIKAIADIAHKHHLPLVVDGTFTTPALLRTIDYGADIVINSLTKWIGGHGSAIGGVVTDSGNFDWSDPKFVLFNQPDKNYHGLRWAIDLPPELRKIAFALRFRTVPLRNLGACLSPDNAWIFLQGVESLDLRMAKHSQNALAVAQYLKKHPQVSWVRYPGLPDDPSYPVAKKYLTKGFGGMVVFGVKGGYDKGVKFIEVLNLFSHLANVGDAKSLALHPSSTSHSQLSEEQQKESGLTPDLIRLSIGIEDIEDIIADIELGLSAAK
ncbi:MAG TPA: aminotransferase class V-fold PLP-dependent enzyme, partial [Spirochaetota bacterium]|nr:aminotransferase class V-fold PLP-dependent enzyme [Spirochaetota bacterium]